MYKGTGSVIDKRLPECQGGFGKDFQRTFWGDGPVMVKCLVRAAQHKTITGPSPMDSLCNTAAIGRLHPAICREPDNAFWTNLELF